jgi:mannose-6-phosphate isomerase
MSGRLEPIGWVKFQGTKAASFSLPLTRGDAAGDCAHAKDIVYPKRLSVMTIELARVQAHAKPWGVSDLRPWSSATRLGSKIGELSYERPANDVSTSALLLKLLFTSQALSIQVHPNDTYAATLGLSNGKTEAWYVLSAAPGAKVALGLNSELNAQQLRAAVDDGSIAELVVWQSVSPDDVLSVPAGTIHAIGAGLVIAEIQQRSDATFRLFDYGRNRELHIDDAVAVANTAPADFQVEPNRLTNERTLLLSNPHFVFERIELAAGSTWWLDAERETWLLVLSGSAIASSFVVSSGDAIVAQSDRIGIRVGTRGMSGLVAYTGVGTLPNLLHRVRQSNPKHAVHESRALPSFHGSPASVSATQSGSEPRP